MNKKNIILIVFAVLTLTIILAGYSYFSQPPKIISSFPQNQSAKNSLDSAVTVKFNVPQKFSKNDLSINPPVKGSWSISKDRKEVKFKPGESFSSFTEYEVKITMKNRMGKIFAETLDFKTKFVYFKDLPEDILKKELEPVDACEEGRETDRDCSYLN